MAIEKIHLDFRTALFGYIDKRSAKEVEEILAGRLGLDDAICHPEDLLRWVRERLVRGGGDSFRVLALMSCLESLSIRMLSKSSLTKSERRRRVADVILANSVSFACWAERSGLYDDFEDVLYGHRHWEKQAGLNVDPEK